MLIGLSAGLTVGLATGSVLLGLLVGALIAARPRLPEAAWTAGAVLGALALSAAALASVPLEMLLPVFLGGLLLHFTAHDPQRPLALLVLGLLLVVAGVRSTSPWFVLALLAWVGALCDGQGRARLALPIGLVSLGLFVLLPRFGSFDLGTQRDSLTGFADDVELGQLRDLLDDPTRVFTARFSVPPTEPVYFRGVALDRFDGRRWWSEAGRTREPDYEGALPDTVRVDVALEAHPERVLFVPGTVDGLDTDGLAVDRDRAGAYHLPGPARRVRYRAFVRPPYGTGRGDPFLDARPRTDLPTLPPRVIQAYREHAGEATTPDARIAALTAWLQRDFRYTRAPRDADPEAPLAGFLLDSREGHCEYFASALAVGGRVLGVPTRVVNGFVGGEPEADGTLVLRRYHAHSWVEYFDGDRWVVADATPRLDAPSGPGLAHQVTEAARDLWEGVLHYDGEQQVSSAATLAANLAPSAPPATRPWIGAVVIGAIAIGLVGIARTLLVRRRRPASPDRIEDELKTLLRPFQGRTDLQRARRAPADRRHLLEELVWIAYAARFGGEAAQPERAASLLQQIKSLPATPVGGSE